MAAWTLFDLTYKTALELGVVIEGTATATGTTITTFDTTDLINNFHDGYFNQGTLWILYNWVTPTGITTLTGLAAPGGEWARITDFKNTTGMLTHTALTVAAPVNSRYAVMNNEYSRELLISQINTVLSLLVIPTVDITTVVTDGAKTEYTLPLNMLDQNIRVWIQRSTTVNDSKWMEVFDWYIAPTSTTVAKKLIFRTQPPEPCVVKIEYWTPHPPLNIRTAALAECLNIDRVVCEAALRCLLWKKSQKSQDDPILDFRTQELAARVDALKRMYPLKRPGPKLATYGIINNFD